MLVRGIIKLKFQNYAYIITQVYFGNVGCWHPEPHERPTFHDVLDSLAVIAGSPFVQTPHESFHTMQDNWRLEIESMFDELRSKEQVIELSGYATQIELVH